MSAGKGDAPRSCWSREFRDNYDAIDWGLSKEIKKSKSVRVGDIEFTEIPTNIVREAAKELDSRLTTLPPPELPEGFDSFMRT